MRVILHGADDDTNWIALRGVCRAFVASKHKDCVYSFTSGIVVHARRSKKSITLSVLAKKLEAACQN